MKVDTNISGSHCVVWKHSEHYLDCRKGTTPWGTPVTNLEAVRNGQVYRRTQVPDTEAPETISNWMKEELV